MDASRSVTALLVDDEPASLTANRTRLENEGYNVITAHSEADALSQAKRSAPKVIFVHLVNTGLGSLALIQGLRADDSCRHIPINLITNRTDRRINPATHAKLHAVPREG